MDSKECMQYDMLHSITLQANISEFLIANADTIFNDKFASLVRKQDVKSNANYCRKKENKTCIKIIIESLKKKIISLKRIVPLAFAVEMEPNYFR